VHPYIGDGTLRRCIGRTLTDGQLATAPIVVNGYVFIGSVTGNVHALDATCGQQRWDMNLGVAIPASDQYSVVQYTGFPAGDCLLVVPSGTQVTAYVFSINPQAFDLGAGQD
jgi:outer membrane protein assembly factor BamB